MPLSEALDKLTELQSKLEQLLSNPAQQLAYPVSSTNEIARGQKKVDFPPPEKTEVDVPKKETKKDLKPKLRTAPTDEKKKFDAKSDINAIWKELLNRIENDQRSILRAHLNSATPVNFDGDKFTIEFQTHAQCNMLDEDDQSVIAKHLAGMTDNQVKVEFTVSQTALNTQTEINNNKPQEMTWLRLKTEAQDDEEVQLAMKFFNGEIIDVKP
jgi:hypothetical protein